MGKEIKSISRWAAVLIVVVCTIAAFWIFGGQNYFANQAEIETGLFTHEDEAKDPIRWLFWLFQTGTVSALIGLLISVAVIKLINARLRSKRDPASE